MSADASGLVLDCAQSITRRLLDRVDEALKADVAYWAAFYDHRLKQGNKHIFHLEGQSRRAAATPTSSSVAIVSIAGRVVRVIEHGTDIRFF